MSARGGGPRPTFAPLPTIAGGWPCIVADPPWRFRDRGSRIAPDQRKKRLGRKGYRTLSLDELICLDVRAVAAKDALLFLWTTSAHLLDGTSPELARSWGFEPKTTISWVKAKPSPVNDALLSLVALKNHKDHFGKDAEYLRAQPRAWAAARRAMEGSKWMWPRVQQGFGHYVRGAHEIVLICRRGRAQVSRRDVPSVFFAPRGRHSAKPEVFRDIVQRLAAGPYLELFARTERPAWMTWGDQVPAREAA